MRKSGRWLVFASILGLLLTGESHAAIYKWVDARGQTHFSDQPPGKHAEKLHIHNTVTPAQRKEAEKITRTYERLDAKYDRQQAQQKAKAQAQARQKALRANYCRELAKEVTVANQHPLVRFKQDGTPQYLTDKETTTYRQHLETLQKKRCSGS